MGIIGLLRGNRQQDALELQERIRLEADKGRQLAIYDQRLGMLSRWYFELRILEECRRCRRYEYPLTLVTLGGSLVGSRDAAQPWTSTESESIRTMMQQVRDTDLVGALGPTEFAVGLIQCDLRGAAAFLRRIVPDVEGVSWQIGLAVFPHDELEGRELIELALSRRAPWKSAGHGLSLAA